MSQSRDFQSHLVISISMVMDGAEVNKDVAWDGNNLTMFSKVFLEPLSCNWLHGKFAVIKWGLSFQERGALGNPPEPSLEWERLRKEISFLNAGRERSVQHRRTFLTDMAKDGMACLRQE